MASNWGRHPQSRHWPGEWRGCREIRVQSWQTCIQYEWTNNAAFSPSGVVKPPAACLPCHPLSAPNLNILISLRHFNIIFFCLYGENATVCCANCTNKSERSTASRFQEFKKPGCVKWSQNFGHSVRMLSCSVAVNCGTISLCGTMITAKLSSRDLALNCFE